MRFSFIFGIIMVAIALVSPVNADFLDRLVDGVIGKAEKKAEDRVNEAAEDVVDSTFDNTEEAVDCALTDKECIQKEETQKPKKSFPVKTGSSQETMECVLTDVGCLKEAKSLGKQVEIIDEEDLDKLRCTVTDIECLKKAKRLGKQVEIID